MFEAVQLLMYKHACETGGELPVTSSGYVSFFCVCFSHIFCWFDFLGFRFDLIIFSLICSHPFSLFSRVVQLQDIGTHPPPSPRRLPPTYHPLPPS